MASITLGLWMLALGLFAILMAERSKGWPATEGKLTIVPTPYRKEIEYSYRVNTVSYTSNRIIFGEVGNRKTERYRDYFGALPDKSQITVYYQPDNPSNSVLVEGKVSENLRSTFFVGVGFLLAGIFFRFVSTLPLRKIP